MDNLALSYVICLFFSLTASPSVVRLLFMKVIGLTGIFGSGKSTVAGFTKKMGAVVIDADKIVHQLYLPEAEGARRVVSLFGPGMLDTDGRLDRQKLAETVFADKDALAKLNAAIHPLVVQQIKTLLADYNRRRGDTIVVIEAPLLIEAGLVPLTDEVWVTTAPRDTIFRRLNRKYGMPYPAVLARIRAQLPVREQLRHATQVINTDTSPERLKAKVSRLWKKTI